MKKVIQNLIMILCIIVFVFFGYKIYNYNKEENELEKLRDDLIEGAIIKNVPENQISEGMEGTKLPIEIDFSVLKSKNKDIVAWLYSEGTPINYPIAQSNDNDYYLRRLLNGKYNQAGTIFMDYRNNSNFNDFNTIIYGHNMKNDTMFGSLINYEKQDYFNEHKNMYLFTEHKNFKIELFAGYITSSESDIYNFPKSSDTNEKLIKMAKGKSTFKSDVEVNSYDKIITLSTCSYDYEDARYVLFGVLRDVNSVETTLGKIKLNSVDGDNNPVSESRFELLDTTGKSYGSVVAGDSGIITFYKVPEGEYILKQIETNSKYRSEEISKNVTVKAGETVEVTFVNSLIKNK